MFVCFLRCIFFLSCHTRRTQNTEHRTQNTQPRTQNTDIEPFFRTFSKIVSNFLYKNHQKNWKTEENSWDWDELNDAFGFFQWIFFEKLQLNFEVLEKNPLYGNPSLAPCLNRAVKYLGIFFSNLKFLSNQNESESDISTVWKLWISAFKRY